MRIRYSGPGDRASITYEGILYRFIPDCEVEDKAAIDYLLAAGSYIQAGDKPKSDTRIPPAAESLASVQDKPFLCETCGRKFAMKSHWANHQRSHQ